MRYGGNKKFKVSMLVLWDKESNSLLKPKAHIKAKNIILFIGVYEVSQTFTSNVFIFFLDNVFILPFLQFDNTANY